MNIRKPRRKRWRSNSFTSLELVKMFNSIATVPIRHNNLLAKFKRKYGAANIYQGIYKSGRNTKQIIPVAYISDKEALYLANSYNNPLFVEVVEAKIKKTSDALDVMLDKLFARFK